MAGHVLSGRSLFVGEWEGPCCSRGAKAVEVPVLSWLIWHLGTGWGSGSTAVLLQPGTPEHQSSLMAPPHPYGVLLGCIAVLGLCPNTERPKQQEGILASPWPGLCGAKSTLCSFEVLCMGPAKSQTWILKQNLS